MRTIRAARDAVVVGVDDTAVSRSAVLWAAEEARLRRLNLLIVHVGLREDDGADAALTRELLLNSSAEAASRREPTVIVGTMFLHGDASARLVDVTRSAALLVLGAERGGLWLSPGPDCLTRRLTSTGRCDIVTVSRRPRINNAGHSQVLAVWTSDGTRAGVLAAAGEEAFLRRAGLTLALPGPGAQDRDSYSMAGDLEELARRYPTLEITVDEIDPTSAAALTNALARCHLAVLGRNDGSTDFRAANLVDGLVRQATCPLLFQVNGSRRAA